MPEGLSGEKTFLSKLRETKKAVKLAILFSLMENLGSGCAASHQVSRETETFLSENLEKTNDPNNYSEMLKRGEFVIPDEVMLAYAKTVDKRSGAEYREPLGGYLAKNYLDKKEEIEEFKKRLAAAGLNAGEISKYKQLLTADDDIVFAAGALSRKDFPNILHHERAHSLMHKLNEKELKILLEAAQAAGKKFTEDIGSGGNWTMAINMNPLQIYSYLIGAPADNDMGKENKQFFTEFLQKNHPEAYKIFLNLKSDAIK